nr:hypothetical protein [Cressdnaviricota sp.]
MEPYDYSLDMTEPGPSSYMFVPTTKEEIIEQYSLYDYTAVTFRLDITKPLLQEAYTYWDDMDPSNLNYWTPSVNMTFNEIHQKVKSFVDTYSNKFHKYAIFKELSHPEDKSTPKWHYQGVIFLHDMEYNTFKTKANEHFIEWKGGLKKKGATNPGGGKRSWTPVKDINQYLSYIAKDNNVQFTNFTETEIATLHDSFKPMGKKTMATETTFERLVKYCVSEGITSDAFLEDVLMKVVEFYHKYCKHFPLFPQLKMLGYSVQGHIKYKNLPREDYMKYCKFIVRKALEY